MCGIVGYIGNENAKEILINGLKKLEYRGYDSAGIALLNKNKIYVFKEVGRINNLESKIKNQIKANSGIGHTRWATHGTPSIVNSHPHISYDQRFIVSHNGVIENFEEIKEKYLQDIKLTGETDTEIITHALAKISSKNKDFKDSLITLLKEIKGSYALLIMDNQNPDKIFAAKNKSPMLIGLGDNFNSIVSDAMAIIDKTNKFLEIKDKEIIEIDKNQVIINDFDKNEIKRNYFVSNIDINNIKKGTYDSYMQKEIEDQPTIMRELVKNYTKDGFANINDEIISTLKKTDRIYIIGNGTSYHAGLIGKNYFEKIAKIPTEVHMASEFSYNMPLISAKNPLFIQISQSGETADSRAVLAKTNKLNYKTLTLTNVEGSTLSREANLTMMLHAGPEISVASTKAYTAQLAAMYILANSISNKKTKISTKLSKLAIAMENLISLKDKIKKLTNKMLDNQRSAFFIGRALDSFVCYEAALKLKEISYIQVEGFSAGELKHGTIALIEKDIPVFVIITQKDINLHTRANVQEVKARGAKCLIIASKSIANQDDDLIIDDVDELLTPLLSVVVTQYISLYAAKARNLDIDKPRNLAKSVTVE